MVKIPLLKKILICWIAVLLCSYVAFSSIVLFYMLLWSDDFKRLVIKNWVKVSLKPLTKIGMTPIMTISAKAVKPEVLQCQKVFQNKNGNILDND